MELFTFGNASFFSKPIPRATETVEARKIERKHSNEKYMKNPLILFLIYSALSLNAQQTTPRPLQVPSAGKIIRYEQFPSKHIASRNIDVWLPNDYDEKQHYAVLYMHDGQMLFDSTQSWNKLEWQVDETATKLMGEKKIKPFIVVGIWNDGVNRHVDYFPQKPFEALTKEQKDAVTKNLQENGRTSVAFQPNSDNYLKFIVEELKPFIDKTYSTYSDAKNTCIAGSSMGGLISLYAVCEYPKVFGGAACLSTHWLGSFAAENNPIPAAFERYLTQHLPQPKTHKIYFDYGDKTLDAYYPPFQKKMDAVMKKKGFRTKNWITRFYPGEDHSEKAWAKRLGVPLCFLLGI